MGYILGFLLVSFFVNALLIVPFINFIYKLKLRRLKQRTRDAFNKPTPIFDRFNRVKAGVPIGGGALIIASTSLIFILAIPLLYYFWVPITGIYANKWAEVKILLFVFISFGLVGLFDDLKKVLVSGRKKFFGLKLSHKLALELFLAFVTAIFLYKDLKITIINLPFFGVVDLGIFYILFAVFVIISFANAYNITDGLDGLAAGILMIGLTAFWVISRSILDTPLSLFITIWLGGLIAFLYFNIYPARIFLGDVGALSFGATLAVIGLILGKSFSLIVIGGVFVLEISTSFFQLISKKLLGRKLFAVSPFHLWLQYKGWHEATIVFRLWLAAVMFAVFGLWLSYIS